jgi:hypothetical protein
MYSTLTDEELAVIAITTMPKASLNALVDTMVLKSTSKYGPHCGKRQQARYLRQIRTGTLKGPHLTDAARLAALGLV